mmetsp:Transcript_1200/g.1751  ORF Transcript_1200/g.1751 Transcript_1200/m.1751 type:complete len:224 (+) Transcript_1200:11-682(+)
MSWRQPYNDDDSNIDNHRHAAGTFLYRHERKNQKQSNGKGNFHLDYDGDLESNGTNYNHRYRSYRSGTRKDIGRYHVATVHGMASVLCKKNNDTNKRNKSKDHGGDIHHHHQFDEIPTYRQLIPGQKIKVLHTPKHVAVSFIIGKKGESIHALQTKYNVECRCILQQRNNNNNNNNKYNDKYNNNRKREGGVFYKTFIWGPKQGVDAAAKEIERYMRLHGNSF